MTGRSHYDVAIIGAGMSGLAAGIRLAHFGKRVCIFERHNAPGGLNGFYSIGGRKFDVGLHAMTNFVAPGMRGTPLGKLLRQLRIDRDEFALCAQKQSRIAFGSQGGQSLRFTNDFAVLESEIAAKFPRQIDGWRALVREVKGYDDVSLDVPTVSARKVVARHLTDPLLSAMIFCPLMYYGSAQERDMDFAQFVIMFKALFLEGFARPLAGVRQIIRVLLEKYRQAGGERRMKCGVARIVERQGRAAALVLDNGEEVIATHVISSAGFAETMRMCMPPKLTEAMQNTGTLSFVETITILNRQPEEFGWGDDTIVFFNDSEQFMYERPKAQVDLRSGVICLPSNFLYGPARMPEGILRVTCLADYDRWMRLPETVYQADKRRWFAEIQLSARRFMPSVDEAELTRATVATDMFTPRTVERFTGHFHGTIYGAPRKIRQGTTHLENLYLCGTDQGFLGIVGAMLSGISMANYHILQKEHAGRAPG
ncbi:MAG: NAD(P)/FAD-dependent oxidoreductase [Opitutaceae bacterium]|nr:NAD(P)/FAD-dependent oxidoreductase [Opitutaceae bacterium]